jgi:hypothetical protein
MKHVVKASSTSAEADGEEDDDEGRSVADAGSGARKDEGAFTIGTCPTDGL